MPNFNTAEMKVAVYRVKPQELLPDDSVEKLKELIEYTIKQDQTLSVAVSFLNHHLSYTSAMELADFLEKNGASITNDVEGLLSFQTKKGHIVSLYLLGGSGRFLNNVFPEAEAVVVETIFTPKKKRASSAKKPPSSTKPPSSRKKKYAGNGLTQECNF